MNNKRFLLFLSRLIVYLRTKYNNLRFKCCGPTSDITNYFSKLLLECKSSCHHAWFFLKKQINAIGRIFSIPIFSDPYRSKSFKLGSLYRNVPLQAWMHKVPVDAEERGSQWPEQWPKRLEKPPYWLLSSQVGVYGKAAPEDFTADFEHWKRVVTKSYLNGLGISWSSVRNVMDMRSIYGG